MLRSFVISFSSGCQVGMGPSWEESGFSFCLSDFVFLWIVFRDWNSKGIFFVLEFKFSLHRYSELTMDLIPFFETYFHISQLLH